MKQIFGDDLKKIQLEILDTVAAFCEENGIRYWIDCGTLLGAIRHKGYIPWDDDIDIGMLRPDYDRFLAEFNGSQEKYKAYSVENDPNFHYSYAKVLDTETILYEPDKNGNKLSINIDVFVYDNVPDQAAANKMYRVRDWYRACHLLHDMHHLPATRTSPVFIALCKVLQVLLIPFPKGYFIKKLVANGKQYTDADTQFVGNFMAESKILCEKSVFSQFTTAEFEGRHYRIPAGYDAWLKAFYGDYMKLPPEEKRVSHHTFEAYMQD